MHKYHKILNLSRYNEKYRPLINFEIKEKLDGANFKFMIDSNGDLIFGTNRIWDIEGTPQGKDYQDIMDYITEKVMKLPFDVRRMWNNEIFFGEAMKPHKIKYNMSQNKLFVGFDVYNLSSQRYRSNWKTCFEVFNLPTVDSFSGNHFNLTPQQYADNIESGDIKSSYDSESEVEGCVFVDYETQSFYKYVREPFREKRTPKKEYANAVERFYDVYFTSNRIDKIIHKLSLDGKYDAKNPLPSVLVHTIIDVMSEATPKDLYNAFGDDLRRMLIGTLMPDYLVRIQELAEQKSEE